MIPAHDEAAVIGRLLDQLLDDGRRPLGEDVQVTVVCNGCSDDTAARAAAYAPRVQVLDLPQPSKHLALVAGDAVSRSVPRLYVDADVELTSSAALALLDALGSSDAVHAVAPERDLALERSARVVRGFYAQWQRLPAVTEGLYGRGVLGVDETGLARIAGRPDVLGDDLYLHQQFAAHERLVVRGASVRIHPPRTVADLLRRRTRAAMGNRQGAATGTTTRTSLGSLVRGAALRPRQLPDVAAYIAITVLARARGRLLARRSGTTWLRDESSRSTGTS